MPKFLKISLWIATAMVAIIALAVVGVFFIDANAFKPRLEAAASRASGMQVRIVGNLRFGFSPGLYVAMQDVQIRNRGIDVGSAPSAQLGIDILPLLQKKVRVRSATITDAKLYIERDAKGILNFENTQKPKGTPRILDLQQLSAAQASVIYVDKKSAKRIEAKDCKLEASRLRLTGMSGADLMTNIQLTANLSCARVADKDYAISNLKLSANGEKGIFNLKPLRLLVFGGQGSGQVMADFSNAEPRWKVQYSLAKFRVEEVLASVQSTQMVKGLMDFTASLSLQGKTRQSLQSSVHGEAILRGENLMLTGRNLDRELARYDSTQNFNLVDLGALFFAGPIGLAITKGHDYANLFRGKGGNSEIRTVLSQWRIEHGVADAQDVAIATPENRLALRGGLDFANQGYQHVTVALVDSQGCTLVRQKIRGPFRKPVVDKPNIIKAFAGPALKLLAKTKEVFTGKQCELFYSGSVAAPDPGPKRKKSILTDGITSDK